MDKDQDRGDLGVVESTQWSSIWTRFLWDEVDRLFYETALGGPLGFEQCKALIQHQPPPSKGWHPTTTCLVEHVNEVERLRADMDNGLLSRWPMPDEFAAYADARRIDLPMPFVSGLRELASGTDSTASAPQATVPVVYASWGPQPVESPAQAKKKRGRPNTSKPLYAAMQREACRVLDEAAIAKARMTIKQVAKVLAGMTAFRMQTIANIERRLKGCLAVKAAAARAREVASMP